MPAFAYRGRDARGGLVTGKLEGSGELQRSPRIVGAV